MPTLVDPSTEVPVNKLPPQILVLGQKHVHDFLAAAVKHGQDWEQVTFAPVARYLHDPGNQTEAAPAYVELRVLNASDPQDARGYILISLTQEDFPVPEFATRGETKTDQVLRAAAGGTIHKFLRFGPGYVVGEDAGGGRLSALGTEPQKIAGQLPQKQVVVIDSESGITPAPATARLEAKPAASYPDLKSDFQSNPLRIHGRALRVQEAAPAWRLANGVRNPALQLRVGETQDFLAGKTLIAAEVVPVDAVELARILVLPKGGLRATGVNAGSTMLKVQEQNGSVDYHAITVAAAATVGATPITTRDVVIDPQFWLAGTDWDGDQRKYDQLERPQWCPAVGCGPTALTMLFGWWDVNGVPSAFYRLEKGQGDPHNFRFNYESLRDSDAPKATADISDDPVNDTFIVPIYNDLHNLSHTICWPTSEQGSTAPDQMISAFQEYVGRIHDHQPSPMNEYGEKFVGCTYQGGHVVIPGIGETDWEGGGKMVARGIKLGFPGVVGIGSWAGDLHYPLAYGFLVERVYIDGDLAGISQYFKCNMGFGQWAGPQYHRAEDVWFGLTAHMWQSTTPTSPNDIIAATFATIHSFGSSTYDRVHVFARETDRMFQFMATNNAEGSVWEAAWSRVPSGVFLSGPAASVSADGQNLHVFGRGNDNQIYRAHSPDSGVNWDVAWSAVGTGAAFTSSPAACLSADGKNVHIFGRGNDNRIWRAHSPDGGGSWDVAWAAIEEGVFTSGPASCVSADGKSLHVFARGNDNRIWRAHSPDGGGSWDVAWAAIGEGTFSSSPAAAISANGQSLYVFGRGNDDRIWWTHSPDGGGTWDVGWSAIAEGTFVSSPAAAISANGMVVHVFGVGKDLRVWRALSLNGGGAWPVAWSAIDGATVY